MGAIRMSSDKTGVLGQRDVPSLQHPGSAGRFAAPAGLLNAAAPGVDVVSAGLGAGRAYTHNRAGELTAWPLDTPGHLHSAAVRRGQAPFTRMGGVVHPKARTVPDPRSVICLLLRRGENSQKQTRGEDGIA